MEMITFAINTENGSPIYLQLYDYLKREIQTGKIESGTKLPSKRKLSSYLRISQNTIRAAYDQLIEEGYVVPIERKGFYINKLDNIVQIEAGKTIISERIDALNESIKYDFSYNCVDQATFPFSIWRKLFKEVIDEYDSELIESGDLRGNVHLRTSIADYLRQSRGVDCGADQIVISSGSEYLFQILIQLFDKENVYGIENPGYEKLNLLFNSNRSSYKAIAIDREGMILEEIEKSGANIICITPAHQFPSGRIMPINRRIQILNWANDSHERFIVEDDYDSEFKYSGKPIPALQGLDTNEKVIYMGAFSKSLSPAIRVSYMVLPEKLMKIFMRKLPFIICPVPTIDQKVLCRFIQEGYFERHLNKMRNVYKKKREFLENEIVGTGSPIEIIGADAGLHLLLKVKNGMSEKQLVESAIASGVRVYGVSKYYIHEDPYEAEPQVLLGYAAMDEQKIKSAVKILNSAWF